RQRAQARKSLLGSARSAAGAGLCPAGGTHRAHGGTRGSPAKVSDREAGAKSEKARRSGGGGDGLSPLLAAGLKARYRAPRLASPSTRTVSRARPLSNRPSGLSLETARSMFAAHKTRLARGVSSESPVTPQDQAVYFNAVPLLVLAAAYLSVAAVL